MLPLANPTTESWKLIGLPKTMMYWQAPEIATHFMQIDVAEPQRIEQPEEESLVNASGRMPRTYSQADAGQHSHVHQHVQQERKGAKREAIRLG
mmetsp:Transcript_40759/g.64591  ORF Transcript_40759/g.64591 Transcript_40759/m.64591 type:complete len:94 (+) Transcript_40759:125-406(+)